MLFQGHKKASGRLLRKQLCLDDICHIQQLAAEVGQPNHKMLLLIDSCKAHVLNMPLKYINVVFLPANTTSLIQPCDQGIIRALKAYYRHEMRARILERFEGNE
ncbi:hypothetical protein AVEN_151400-1 [Araneus ventricosus]|uniref:DDE-1 domain-containing protein n=1 Tax=Araneus ventricosus TaxID=182803 RepID=A0A4Y2CAX1_ARAVE|nr:hypothetical protein AVEN_151400-1 [Araneus ventricosus]